MHVEGIKPFHILLHAMRVILAHVLVRQVTEKVEKKKSQWGWLRPNTQKCFFFVQICELQKQSCGVNK